MVLTMGNNNLQLLPPSETEFFFRNNRFKFIKDAGAVKALILYNNYGVDQEAKKIQ